MTEVAEPWTARISVRPGRAEVAEWLARALGPEATREVPRAHAKVSRPAPDVVEVAIRAADAGAMRAALNTYLGWVQLSLTTAEVARPPAR
ncbi:MAG TPA: KEOPS complex subunit Pcc1 [Thermoplasmata archaeon]|nr:KEOPS complex subunit Pcc1 [Thermoplasmata archaeon]